MYKINSRRLIFAFCLVLCGLVLGVNHSSAIEYGGLGARPTNPDPNNARTESIFVYTLAGGEQKSDAVTVYNNSSTKKDVLVYAVDAQTSNTGAFTCEQLADQADEVGKWITLSASELSIEPTKSQEVPFEVLLPAQVDAGEHNGCIVIQEKAAESSSSGVALSFRSAIRVAIRTPGDITKKLSFTDFVVTTAESGVKVLSPSLKNEGNVSIDATLSVTATNILPFGAFEAGGQFPVLSNQSADFNFEFPQTFWGGLYRAKTVATYNSDPDATLGEDTDQATSIESEQRWFFMMPSLPALAIELAVILTVGGFIGARLHSRRRIAKLRNSWQEYTVVAGDNIKSIAAAHHISWKKFASINKLKPPYSLEDGQTVRVPKTRKTSSSSKSPKKSAKKSSKSE